jgi:glyceraldehyde-3-phosphate dehydrogenase (NADP+)
LDFIELNMQSYPIYCAGRFISTTDELSVSNPFTNQPFAITYRAAASHFEEAVKKAQSVQEDLAKFPTYERSRILMQIAEELEKEEAQVASVLCRESAKPMRYALGEVQRAIQSFRIAAEETKRFQNEYMSLDWTPSGKGKEGLVRQFPIGLVAGISPFNFPLNLAVHKIAPALASGCPIVLKPSSSTPLSTLLLAQIIDKTALPKGAVSILPMDRETGNRLVTDDRFKLLSFTGSPEVGWKMKTEAGRKKVVLELGGNAGVIVSKSADVDHAVKQSLIGGFAYSGQVCIHAQRFFVSKTIFSEFSEKFIRGVKGLKMGDPMDPETEISVMIDEDNARRIEDWVNDAVKGGARILTGGKREGSYYEPTVLTNTQADMNVCALEVFGPVVTLEPFDSFEEAIHLLNQGRFGLQAGVFTNRIEEMDVAFYRLEVGGVVINDVPTFRVDHMPYGGVKDSGLGREGIRYAMMDMMEPRILVKNRL